MVRLWHIAAWPLVVKVPVLVAGLMVTVAATTSQVVLWRFAQDQKSNLERLTGAYLNGLSARVLPALVRGNQREVFDVLDLAQSGRYPGFEPRFTIVELRNETILASSDPRRFPVQSAVPDELRRKFPPGDGLNIDTGSDSAWLAKTLSTEGLPVGRLFAELDISASSRARHEILLTLVLVNGCLTLAFALGGYFVLKRMLQPLGVLTRYVEQIREGRVETFQGVTTGGSPASLVSYLTGSMRWHAPSANGRPSRPILANKKSARCSGGLPRAWPTRSTTLSLGCLMPLTPYRRMATTRPCCRHRWTS